MDGNGNGNRTQPEFSLGERMARIEAETGAMDRRFIEAGLLFDEKLGGLRREMEAKSTAQKEAVDKAERSTSAQFATFVEADTKKSDVTQTRLAALETGRAGAQGVSEWWGRAAALVAALAALGYLLYLLVG
jgi:hypothetical protein